MILSYNLDIFDFFCIWWCKKFLANAASIFELDSKVINNTKTDECFIRKSAKRS